MTTITSTTTLNPATLFSYYTAQVKSLETLITQSHNGNIPEIIAFFVSNLIPQIISDVNKVQNLPDAFKKQLLIDTVKYFIKTVYSDLVAKGDIPDDQLNEMIEESVIVVVTPTIDMLIDVQNGAIVLTPTTKSFFAKLFSCSCCRKAQ
ncbi:MAG: hypothetical protein Solivirus5_6 [Solivirus sp.]|uniref:Uncharacterized protein n=1 Tax=Solivirus sp. TaxID=2487772 RepID=A0A3G5AG22_9VIRU|nr:MAG: hypothetical protein Solivirus5_6 [Solivirus sp.]